MDDLIRRQDAIEALIQEFYSNVDDYISEKQAVHAIDSLPSAQPETCEGCKHLGKWENEVEYGYPSPCTSCKRRVEDHYER